MEDKTGIIFNGIDNDYLKLIIDEDFYNFGRATIDINVGCYLVKNVLWIYTEDLKELYKNLDEMYQNMNGNTHFNDPEEIFEVSFKFNKRGYVIIMGKYKEDVNKVNELKFEFECSQPQLYEVMNSIYKIISI